MDNELADFELGEKRKVTLRVWGKRVPIIELTNCAWKLKYKKTETTESSGDCTVTTDDRGCWFLDALIQPAKRGSYILQFSFDAAEEIIIRSVEFRVV